MNHAWQARIGCGSGRGSGFLVTDRHVLTCAHVVKQHPAHGVTVAFPQLDALERRAEVVAHGGWRRLRDPGDLAVLELTEPVALRPAAFAPLSAAYGSPPPKLLAYGFPRTDTDGAIAECRATGRQLINQEWGQLEAWSTNGAPLAPGFSGCALVLADSGQVVGMATSSAGDPQVRTGRMLPAQVMARYWPRLGELIPTTDLDTAAKARLRLLLDRAEDSCPDRTEDSRTKRPGRVTDDADPGLVPDQLYRDAVGAFGPPPPVRGFRSLWDAAWFLLTEVEDGAAALGRFTARLADRCEDAGTRTALRNVVRGSGPAAARGRESAAGRTWSPVLVEVAPSGSGDGRFVVEVSAYSGGHRHFIGHRTLASTAVRTYVEERIDEAYHQVDLDGRELIAFVLPRQYINIDVVHWQRSADDDSPLGSFAPVVVVDMERRRSGGLQHHLRRRWQELDGRADARLHRVDCAAPQSDPKAMTVGLRTGRVDLLGLGAPPGRARAAFKAGLNAPVPVVIWPRTGCAGGSHEACSGKEFLDRLAERLAQLPPGELPEVVHELRLEAFGSGDTSHWARDLSLLWEDPRALPEAPPFAGSPVG